VAIFALEHEGRFAKRRLLVVPVTCSNFSTVRVSELFCQGFLVDGAVTFIVQTRSKGQESFVGIVKVLYVDFGGGKETTTKKFIKVASLQYQQITL